MYKNKKKQGTPKLGGMWEKQSKKGESIFSISINADQLPEPDENGRIRLTALVNNYKEEETHPDYNLLVSTPKEQYRGNKGGGFKGRPAQRPAPGKFQKRAPVQQEVSEDETDGDETGEGDDESIPF